MFGAPVFLFGLLVTWATPIWLLSVGVALGVVALGVALVIVFLVSRRAATWVMSIVREGILLPIFYAAIALTGFAAVGVLLIPGLPYGPLIAAVSRLPAVGPRDVEVTIPPA